MELKTIIIEYLDICRKLENANLPEGLERSLKFRMDDLDDIIVSECQKSAFPNSDSKSDEAMLGLIKYIEMYKEFEKKKEQYKIYSKDELIFLTKELEKFDSEKVKSYYQKMEEKDGYSIERKKIKGGNYEYFVADYDGKVVKKFPKDFFDFEYNLANNENDASLIYRYEFHFPSYETKIAIDSDLIDEDNKDSFEYDEFLDQYFEATVHKEDTVNLYGVINRNGDIIFDGCETATKIEARGEFQFILRLNCKIHKDKILNDFNPRKDGIWCVIDNEGNYIIEPTNYGVRYNDVIGRYESFYFSLNN